MKRIPLLHPPYALLFFGGAVVLICFPSAVKEGVGKALVLCSEALIPSLFPFFCLCFLAVEYLTLTQGFFSRAFCALFRLPPCAAAVFGLSLLSGYPSGIMMTENLLQKGRINGEQAKRMSLFCCSSGPAFSVLAVGEGICGSRKTGLIFLAATVLSQCLIGIILAFFAPKKNVIATVDSTKKPDFSTAFTAAVEKSTSAMLGICAYVLLFGALSSLLSLLPLATPASAALTAVLEVTTGCVAFADNPVMIAFILGFGGFSVFFQIKKYLSKTGTSSFSFLLAHLVSGALCAGICKLLLLAFPQTVPVLAGAVKMQAVSFSAPLSAMLVLSFAVLVLDNKRVTRPDRL